MGELVNMRARATAEFMPPPPNPPPPESRRKMVGWFDPAQLAPSGIQVVLSTIFGRHADHRLLEALASSAGDDMFDYSAYGNGQAFWLDYAADLGDGWDSTYAVAYHLAQPTLAVGGQETRRGSILIFGGDEVYPIASRAEYEARLVAPYATALRHSASPDHLDLFAVPGNHDWYDSLVSFTRLFIAKQWLGGWRCPQARSYFAAKLPGHWWLLGTDVQLGSDIDQPQIEYFQQVAQHMKDGDQVILCNAEPHWIYAAAYGIDDSDYSERNLAFLENKVLERRVAVFLSGDLHHYRRHATDDGFQKITAGGGGAYLHPTHGMNVDLLAGGYKKRACFPDESTSRKLCWRNLLFPVNNPKFGLVTAILYVLTAWSVKAPIGEFGLRDILQAARVTLHEALNSPAAAFWGIATIVGFWLFTDTHSRRYRIIAGPLHGLAHALAAFLLGWGGSYLCVHEIGFAFGSIRQLLLSGLLIAAGGWPAGSFIMGLYLFVSLNWFGRHHDEAFSALSIRDWKNFLRIRINADGELTIFPIGLRRVPRQWKSRDPGAPGPELVPDDLAATAPELIEPPIAVHFP